MTPRFAFCLVASLAIATGSAAQAPGGDPVDTRVALGRALAEQRAAAVRAGKLEAAAAAATARADKTAQNAAALAARIQQAEAGIAAGEARLAMLETQRTALRETLGRRQAPLVRLTGALQLMARRPLALAVLQPGSLQDTVHTRAVLDTMVPVVRRRSAGVRAQLVEARRLTAAVRTEQAALRREQATLGQRRTALAALETRQRLESRNRRGAANRESDRALALAEEARDLSVLVGTLEQAGALRRQLAALPGPVLRPAQPAFAAVRDVAPALTAAAGLDYILPLTGPVVAGFGEASSGGGMRSKGITILARPGAQVIAPAAGRIAFAGRYKGYGQVVIVEHDGGWTSLITDLAAVGPAIGDRVVQGAPLGVAGAGSPRITIELRKDGVPVDVLGAVTQR